LNENKQPILISGRVDTKKLKEKYPEIWADCLVPTKSVEYKFEIVKSNA
jgi:predicted phage-related endonuclease